MILALALVDPWSFDRYTKDFTAGAPMISFLAGYTLLIFSQYTGNKEDRRAARIASACLLVSSSGFFCSPELGRIASAITLYAVLHIGMNKTLSDYYNAH